MEFNTVIATNASLEQSAVDIASVIEQVAAGKDLSMDRMADVIGQIMEGRCAERQIAELLMALHRKGEATSEVAGAAAAMRKKMTPIRSRHSRLLDVVGTGGDRSGTFNISTAAALVASAAGVPVAKHGNRGFTSRSGSADVLAKLGVNIEADVSTVEKCLNELGICFCFAPLLHKAMKHVAPVRKTLSVPTIFNIIGPLANPAGAQVQLLGVGRKELCEVLAEASRMLGTQRVVVVHGSDGLDEVTLAGPTIVFDAQPDGVRRLQWTPADFGLPEVDSRVLVVENPEQSAEVIRRMLDRKPGPARDVVVANAAAALWAFGVADKLRQCVELAATAIDTGRAAEKLQQLASLSHAAK